MSLGSGDVRTGTNHDYWQAKCSVSGMATKSKSTSAKGKSQAASRQESGSTQTASEHSHSSHSATTTTNHDEIRKWAEDRGAKPACVKGTGDQGDVGMLRLDFPGYTGEDKLQHITWEEWFEKFDERQLALLHQEETAEGQKSNFNKLVSRETARSAH
ncbi:MAG: hypothetical protein U0Q18_26820 [Bryobacteraceae bacterium]